MKIFEDVYNRIFTDIKFNPINFVITYHNGIKKIFIDLSIFEWIPTKLCVYLNKLMNKKNISFSVDKK